MFFKYNLFAIVWAAVIFLLILLPGDSMPYTENIFSFDKLAHAAVFSILTFLLIIGFSKQYRYQKLRSFPEKYSTIICLVYASGLELGQSIVPDRFANLYDLAFNLLGVFLGYALFLVIYKFSFV